MSRVRFPNACGMPAMLADFHSHTTLSDGHLSFEELVAAAELRGYDVLAITDHARKGEDYREITAMIRANVERLARDTPMTLFSGVELTDFDPPDIRLVAEEVRMAGAEVVVVHGECVVLDVTPGTNAAAARSPSVDILAHPGLITPEDAAAAAANNVYLEISAIHGASYANGHVYRAARRSGASIVVDSDAHTEPGLLSRAKVRSLLFGAGADEAYIGQVQSVMLPSFLRRLYRQLVCA